MPSTRMASTLMGGRLQRGALLLVGRQFLHDRVVDVHVGEDALDIIVVFQSIIIGISGYFAVWAFLLLWTTLVVPRWQLNHRR